MADAKLTSLTAATPAAADVAYIVDVSDTTDDAAGSSRKTTLASLMSALAVGRTLFDHSTDTSTTHTDGTEDDLYSDTIAAAQLANDNDKLEAYYCLTIVSSATANRRIKAYFGGTLVLDSGSQTFAATGTCSIYLNVIRESSSVVRVMAELVITGITFQPSETYTRITGLTLTNTQVLKLTGIASGTGAASADIVAKLGSVKYQPKA